jgi:hypothetical protein
MGFGLTPLLGDPRGFMPPQLKTNKTNRFLLKQELRFGLDLGQMANFSAFIASKSFDL